jgi:molybdenum cofactor cytidylyltransferase
MKFGDVPVAEAEGAILAHSLRLAGIALKKGRVLSTADLEAIAAAGLDHVVAARLDPDDIREDAAAERISVAAA